MLKYIARQTFFLSQKWPNKTLLWLWSYPIHKSGAHEKPYERLRANKKEQIKMFYTRLLS
jgi:hypothetical protein